MDTILSTEETRRQQRGYAEDRHFAQGFDGGKTFGQIRLDVMVMRVNRAKTLAELQALASTHLVAPEGDFLEQLRQETMREPPIAQAAVVLFSCRNQINQAGEALVRAEYNLADVPLAYYIQLLLERRESLGINWMRTTEDLWPGHLLANLVGQWEQRQLPYDHRLDLTLSSRRGEHLYAGPYQRLVYEANWLNKA